MPNLIRKGDLVELVRTLRRTHANQLRYFSNPGSGMRLLVVVIALLIMQAKMGTTASVDSVDFAYR